MQSFGVARRAVGCSGRLRVASIKSVREGRTTLLVNGQGLGHHEGIHRNFQDWATNRRGSEAGGDVKSNRSRYRTPLAPRSIAEWTRPRKVLTVTPQHHLVDCRAYRVKIKPAVEMLEIRRQPKAGRWWRDQSTRSSGGPPLHATTLRSGVRWMANWGSQRREVSEGEAKGKGEHQQGPVNPRLKQDHRRVVGKSMGVEDGGLGAAKHQVKHRVTEKVGIKVAERVAERVVETAEEVAVKVGERSAKTAGRKILTRFPVLAHISEHIVGRVGRGALISLPVIGGVFAAWIGRSDWHRTVAEIDRGNHAAVACFAGATSADAIDAAAHFVVAYGMFEGWPDQVILDAWNVSLVSAVVSTTGAVAGEILCKRQVDISGKADRKGAQRSDRLKENPPCSQGKGGSRPPSAGPGV
ncbi:unnamed protein product [Choristocarpus tenellus]